MLEGKIAERVRADYLRYLIDRVVAGDQVLPRVNVGAVIARVDEGRGRDTHMHLFRARLADQIHYMPAGRAADNRVVDENHALSLYRALDRVQLYAHLVLPLRLTGGNEGSAYVLVLDETDAVGDARRPRIAERRVETRIRHADDDIRVDRMLLCEELSRPEMRLLNRHAVDHRIRTREIDILEQTQRVRLLPAVRAYRAHPLGAEHHYLARLDIADKLRADRRQRATLGRHDIAPVRADSVTQRSHPARVAQRYQLHRRHDDQRIGTIQPVHRRAHRLLDRRVGQALARHLVGDYLGVARRMEDRALQLELTAELRRVRQVAVVRHRHCALDVSDLYRLTVRPRAAAGRAVPDMPDSYRALAERRQCLMIEHLVDKPDILMRREHAVLVDDDAAALLPAVLEGVETVIDGRRYILIASGVNAEYAAFLVDCVEHFLLLNLIKTPGQRAE